MTDIIAIDVNAALQAAVAAAAEIARVGLSDENTIAFQHHHQQPPQQQQEMTPHKKSPEEFSETLVTPALQTPTLAATLLPVAPRPTPVEQQQQQGATSNNNSCGVQRLIQATSSTDTARSEHAQSEQMQQFPVQQHNCKVLNDPASAHSSNNHLSPLLAAVTRSSSPQDSISLQQDDAQSLHSGFAGGEAAAAAAVDERNSSTAQDPESEEDAAKRLARSRERNREHARRTRLRKKAQLESLQQKVRGLETERKSLKQKIEECSIASILITLAEPSEVDQAQQQALDDTIRKQQENTHNAKITLLTAGKRKRFASIDSTASEDSSAGATSSRTTTQTLKLKIDGQIKMIGPKSHINWKSGLYSDEHGVQRQLTSEQLEGLRRERNRMHAKMTRDRKKNFIATIEKTIEELERDCERMRDVLNKVGAHEEAAAAVLTAPAEQAAGTSTVTPVIAPLASPNLSVTAAVPVANKPKEDLEGKYPSSFSLAAPASTAPSVDHLLTPKTIQEHHEPALKAEPFPEYPEKHAKVTHGFSWAA